jgi:hypothetical protein
VIGKAVRVARSPRTYVRALAHRTAVAATRLLSRSLGSRWPFFVQSRMDIDPRSAWNSREVVEATGGFFPRGSQSRGLPDVEAWDRVRRDMLLLLLREVESRGVQGAFAELGVWRGATARLLHHYAPHRRLYLFDTFAGFGDRAVRSEREQTGHDRITSGDFSDTSEALVRATVAAQNGNVELIKGLFPESIPSSLRSETFAFVHLDADLYAPIKAGLEFFYPRLAARGIIVVHDYNAWIGARQAVTDFCESVPGLLPIPMPDKSGSCVLQKATR